MIRRWQLAVGMYTTHRNANTELSVVIDTYTYVHCVHGHSGHVSLYTWQQNKNVCRMSECKLYKIFRRAIQTHDNVVILVVAAVAVAADLLVSLYQPRPNMHQAAMR